MEDVLSLIFLKQILKHVLAQVDFMKLKSYITQKR